MYRWDLSQAEFQAAQAQAAGFGSRVRVGGGNSTGAVAGSGSRVASSGVQARGAAGALSGTGEDCVQ